MQSQNFGVEPALVLVVSNGLAKPVRLAPYFQGVFRFKLVDHDVDKICDAVRKACPNMVLFDRDAVSNTDIHHILNLLKPYTERDKTFSSFLFAKKRKESDELANKLWFEQVSLKHSHLDLVSVPDQAVQLSLEAALNTNLNTHDEDVRLEERRRIAREVHDELGQLLSCMRLRLFEFESGKVCAEQVSAMYALIDQAQVATRDILQDLRAAPQGAELSNDFSSKLESLVSAFIKESGISCVLNFINMADAIQVNVANVLTRTVQEALTNVMRYAQANHVMINVSQKEGEIVLTVKDDGVGFDHNDLLQKKVTFGLIGMKERADLLGGQLTVNTKPKHGTEITVTLPCKRYARGDVASQMVAS